jgi:hypothetical protein
MRDFPSEFPLYSIFGGIVGFAICSFGEFVVAVNDKVGLENLGRFVVVASIGFAAIVISLMIARTWKYHPLLVGFATGSCAGLIAIHAFLIVILNS